MRKILMLLLFATLFVACEKEEVKEECYTCQTYNYSTMSYYLGESDTEWSMWEFGASYENVCTEEEQQNIRDNVYYLTPHINNVGDTLWWYKQDIVCE